MILLAMLKFAVVFSAFLAPGYGVVGWLHRSERLNAALRWSLAFAWSLALFALMAGPFLWCGGQFSALLWCVYPLWAIYGVVGTIGYLRSQRANPPQPASVVEPPSPPANAPAPASVTLMFGAWLVLAAVGASLWVRSAGSAPRMFFLLVAAFMVAGGLLGRRLYQVGLPWLRWSAADDEPAPRLWIAAALGMILVQAASAVCYSRPDWDDCYYLAAVADYQSGGHLNQQEPTHREGFPIPSVQRLLCWELWGAVVCQLTGLQPLLLFHTLLPGLLVLLAYAAYTALFSELLPGRWAPLALIGLSAYHLWGISGHATAANHFLPRLWQGKAILLHIAIPLLVVTLMRYAAAPSWRRGLCLTVVVVFGLGVSLSAIFLSAIVVGCLLPGLLRNASRRRGWIILGSMAAVAPLVLCGLLVRAATQGDPVLRGRPPELTTWYQNVAIYAPLGSSEALWLVCLPLLASLLPNWRSRAYLIGFPIVLGLTFANPALYDAVALHLTSYVTYYRVLWLFPVGPGLGVLLALGVRLVSVSLSLSTGRQARTVPIALATIVLFAFTALPGMYVWSPHNSFIGPLGTPHLAQDPEKMPADLLPLARRMLSDPNLSETRLLCDEQVASFLTGYNRRFRFVQTRAMYTAYYLNAVGRSAEGRERCLLADWLVHPRHRLDRHGLDNLRAMYGDEGCAAVCGVMPSTTPEGGILLRRYRVKYILTAPGDEPTDLWQQQGFQRLESCGGFVLWQTPAWAGRVAKN